MSKQSDRRRRAYMIRAAEKAEHTIVCSVESVEWIKAAEGETPAEGPKKFKMRAYTGGPMQVGYYGAPVAIDLSGLTAKAPIPILMNHDADRIVGHADEVTVGDSTLDLAGLVSGASAESDQVTASAKLGFPWKASVGARPDKMEFVGECVTTKVNGKTLTGPLYVARKSTLGEVSFVALAADSKTTAKVAASAKTNFLERNEKMTYSEWLEANGEAAKTLTEKQLSKLKASFDPEPEPDPAPPPAPAPGDDPVAKIRAAAAAESARIAAIDKLCVGFADIKATAIAEGWTPEKAENAVLKAQLPKPLPTNGSTRDISGEVIEAALSRSVGLVNREKAYKPEVLEAADKLGGYSLGETLLHQAVLGGYSGRQKITESNLREVLRAAFSTHTLTTLLTNLGHKMLLDGFNSLPQSWREVAQVRPVNDFKTWTLFRMTADMEFKQVGPGGEIQHGTLGQESYTMKADTYARMIALTRQDIINDDLGALNDIRNRLGIGAAVALNKAFWTAWLAAYNGAAFWTAARGNLVTSSSLGDTGLATAVKAFRDLAGPDGNMLNLEPDRMLVPSALEGTARKWYASQEMRDTTASTKSPNTNIYYNRFRPVVVPELGNSAYTGYSATTWYLLANPAVLASGLVCFLNGNQTPTVESADADFETLGIQFRSYTDFGVGMSEYRASVAAEA